MRAIAVTNARKMYANNCITHFLKTYRFQSSVNVQQSVGFSLLETKAQFKCAYMFSYNDRALKAHHVNIVFSCTVWLNLLIK